MPPFASSRCRPALVGGALRTGAAAGALLAGLVAGAHAAAEFVEFRGTELRFHNAGATLVLARAPWRMRLEDPAGRVQFADAAAPAFQIDSNWVPLARLTGAHATGAAAAAVDVELASGQRATATVATFGPDGFEIVVRPTAAAATAVRGAAVLRPIEEIYGFGEMWNGHVAQRGQSFDLWDRSGTPDECAYMPYYVSTRNYAFFLNYGGRVHFDVGQHRADRLTYEAPAHVLDLAIVRGDSIANTVRHFLTQVGLPQRPPRWAFMPWFWLMGDPAHPGAKIDTLRGEHFLEMVRKLHDLSIPIGVTWFEPPWQDGRTTFRPNPQFSRDLPGLVRELGELGVHTLAWTVPYTTNTASNWNDAVEHQYLVSGPSTAAGPSRMQISGSGELVGAHYNYVDFYNPEAVRWWQAQIEGGLANGIRGYKLDAAQDLEPDAELHGGRIGRDVRNAYALAYDRAYFEVLKKHFGDDFLMIPRAAWVGSSAYTNFKWPGDLSGSFANNGLPSSVYASLSLAFCGIPFVATDIGGFEDQPVPERPWLRWAQFGALLPGMETLHMPWWYSQEALDHFRFLAWLHTDLTPLWMSLAHEAAETGAPVCRPLVWTFQDDIDCWRVDDEYTVGDALLVAPMLNNNPDRQVYLPSGTWYDFWDDSHAVHGPATVHWFKGWFIRDKFPLYIREGAIIPLDVSNRFSGFGWPESKGYVTLAIWPKANGTIEFTLHDTEGPIRITATRTGDTVRVAWGATHRNHLLRIHVAAGRPLRVAASDGRPLAAFPSLEAFRGGGQGWWFDGGARKLWIRQPNDGTAGSVTVKLGEAR